MKSKYLKINGVIQLKPDMLEVKKDRVKEIDKQLKRISKIKKSLRSKNYMPIGFLKNEKRDLLQEIKDIESKRGVINE